MLASSQPELPPIPVLESLVEGIEEARATVVEAGSFCMGVVGPAGTARWAEPAFTDLMGDPVGPDCRRLAQDARRVGRAVGLVITAARGSLVVEARRATEIGAWPAPGPALEAMESTSGAVLVVVFAPTRAPGLALASAKALGLAPREADLAAALLELPNLESAAASVGMNTETAKDALDRACRRVGATGASGLTGRLLDLLCGEGEAETLAVAKTLGLSPAEARVAGAVAQGLSIAETAQTLGLAPATVKSARKLIFAKTGASRDRDLRRLWTEASRLAGLHDVAEVVPDDRSAGERLRVFRQPNGRRVALIDYGPFSGAPLFVMHGFNTGRRLPLPFASRLQRDGWRPIVVQRPGFGLTDPACGAYLEEAADDMAAVLHALGGSKAAVLARDGGVASAISLAERHSSVFRLGGVVNPRSTRERPVEGVDPLKTLSKMLLRQPALIAPVAEAFRKRTAGAQSRAVLQRLYGAVDDGAAPRPDVLDHVVRDAQAMSARTVKGMIDELRVYADGWRLPSTLPSGPWRVAWGPAMWREDEMRAWTAAGAQTRRIDGLGLLGAYTHPDALADLIAV